MSPCKDRGSRFGATGREMNECGILWSSQRKPTGLFKRAKIHPRVNQSCEISSEPTRDAVSILRAILGAQILRQENIARRTSYRQEEL